MDIVQTRQTVTQYCAAMARGELMVNRDYQRSDQVWPPAARSFLIETILLGYPMPKFYLFQKTDIKSKKTYNEIVDGQQRSMAIRDFYENKLRLSSRFSVSELRGKKYDDLSDEYKHKFLDYGLPIDQFVSATAEDIREVFRRMNSYNVVLNPEEHRHATYQGAFKWFVYNLTKKYDDVFASLGVFPEKQLVRMADAKLFTELVHALRNGITTTTKTKLDQLYRDLDGTFPEERAVSERIERAFDVVLRFQELSGTSLMKPYVFYSLFLAVMHALQPVSKLRKAYPRNRRVLIINDVVRVNLTALASVLDGSAPAKQYKEFIKASEERTNVAEQRRIRFKWLSRALEPRPI